MSGMKSPIKWHTYRIATTVYDLDIPIISYLADIVRDWVYEDQI